MKRTKYSEEQIIRILKEEESGAKTSDLCRQHGISDATFYNWKAYRNNVKLDFIRPGKSIENVYIKSFPGKLRDECLNDNWFLSLAAARETIEACRMDYNRQRPNSSLDNMTPWEFREKFEISQGLTPASLLRTT